MEFAATQPADRADGREPERFVAGDGRTVYRLPLEVFPGFWGNAYLIDGGAHPILVDSGSGQPQSDRCLLGGFETIRERWNAPRLEDVGRVVLSHGHIDHLGGLHTVRRHTDAPIFVHVLDKRIPTHWHERLVVTAGQVEHFLATTGISTERKKRHVAAWFGTKRMFRSIAVDGDFEEGPLFDGELVTYHVPGHCPGMVCLKVDDILLTADHVLPRISPILTPEALTLNNGVGHYLSSLDHAAKIPDVRLGLGGHFGKIDDVYRRIDEIRALHLARHAEILELCHQPRTIDELSRTVFGTVESYHIFLALLETGAHVEYLYQRGALVADNLDELETGSTTVIRYRST
ncbi:MAG: MBL fold metallo-hydrolase [Acidobacteriota bacterium]